LLTNDFIRLDILEPLALLVCEGFKIEGGKKSVCMGAIDSMAQVLLPSLAHGIFSPLRVCDEILGFCKSPDIQELSAD